MALKVAIFEDDKDLADDLKNDLGRKDFSVSLFFSLESKEWLNAEIVLADFRNRLVPFDKIRGLCEKNDRPLIAISGADSNYKPQVLKPFTADQLQRAILSALAVHKKHQAEKAAKNNGMFKSFFGLFGGSKGKS